MPDTAELSALLTDCVDQLDRRLTAVHDLRREARAIGPQGSAEALPVLDPVDGAAQRRDESARVLLRWLRAGSN